jgi:hypothetical protein
MRCLLRTVIVVMAAGTSSGLAPQAHAADETVPPSRVRAGAVPRYAWGLRLNGSWGGGGLQYADDGALVGRVGLDGEYWLSKNVGVGAQLAYESAQTFSPGGAYNTGRTSRASVAPAVAIRGSNPTSFPLLTLALGYAFGSSTEYHACDLNSCPETYWTALGSGPYASLMAAWSFHPGHARAESTAFALGPLIRLDAFGIGDRRGAPDAFSNSNFEGAWCLTAGLTIGFDVASKRTR